jgi:thymidylate synthase ThyX
MKEKLQCDLLFATPLWLASNATRMSHDSHHHSDTDLSYISGKCPPYTGDKDKDLIKRIGVKLKHESIMEMIDYHWDVEMNTKTLLAFSRHRVGVSLTMRCIAGDSMVTTSVGKREIQDLYQSSIQNKNLPKVRTYCFDTKQFVYSNISEVFYNGEHPTYKLTTKITNKTIECTENHKFLTKKGWVKLKDLQEGDVISINGDYSIVYDIVDNIQLSKTQKVYDIGVANIHHNYVANGIVTHNSTRYTTSKRKGKHEVQGTEKTEKYLKKILEIVDEAIEDGMSDDEISLLLPQAYIYRGQIKFNGRSLMHFLELRLSKHAHRHITELAKRLVMSIPSEHRYLYLHIVEKHMNDEFVSDYIGNMT